MKRFSRIVAILVVLQMVGLSSLTASAYVFGGTLKETKTTTIAPGVNHIYFNYEKDKVKEKVNMLEVDLLNPYATIEMGVSDPISKFRTTSALAKLHTYESHQVVGAVNASFFSSTGPFGLLVENNEILQIGPVVTNTESPIYQPTALGIDQNGKMIAGYYQLNLTFEIDGQVYKIHDINSTRDSNENVLYTNKKATTGTNNWGTELIVTGVLEDMSKIEFGSKWSGTVAEVKPYGQGNAAIPTDGFVLSIQNKDLATALANSTGKQVKVTLDIDDKWKNAKFILGTGPLLVQNGQVQISMPTNEPLAKDRHPRTALMIDATGTKVKLVTVDGRVKNHSNGTNLTDLANYLISHGAYSAINLDGGGSTTMVARFPGKQFASMVNKPSDGSERIVSTILQVVNLAPTSNLMHFNVTAPSVTTEQSVLNLTVSGGYDSNLQPIDVSALPVEWTVEGDIGHITNGKFTATKAGVGAIVATINGITVRKEVTVNPFVPSILIDSLTTTNHLVPSSIRGTTNVSMTKPGVEASREQTPAVKLAYEMNTSEVGTSANYVSFASPLAVVGAPKKLGMWVYGDKKNHWLRASIKDASGVSHTIDFTKQNGLNWSGWKFVQATIPTNVSYPINVEKIYVTEPIEAMKSNGAIYLSDLKAIYADNYSEKAFTDIIVDNWSGPAITYFANKDYITGYKDGTFKPANTITRGEAAVIIQRVLGIQATTDVNPFKDIKATSYDYKAILAVNETGIMTGKSEGVFDPSGQLTRAEMAAILVRAFKLTGTSTIPYPDVNLNNWSTEPISILVANNLVTGFSDGTFRPQAKISRAEFATFIYRVLTK